MFNKKIVDKKAKYFLAGFAVLAAVIVFYVLFRNPQPGVADQGDFDRVMGPVGLGILDSDASNSNFIRFYKYTVTNYKMFSYSGMFINVILGSSIGYLISIVKFLCGILGLEVFKTQYLAFLYSVIYIAGFMLILKNLKIHNKIKFVILGLMVLFVFFDGNYLVWFNSLYGEPMILTTLIMFIASLLYYINCSNNEDVSTRKLFYSIVLVLMSGLMFLGSKMQVITALPFIFIFFVKMLCDNRRKFTKIRMTVLIIMTIVVCAYPVRINMVSKGLSQDTQYNSVFYGVLNGSETPKQDLIDLGLNPDMYVEAGKHSYLAKDEYVKYIPHTEITEKEFYSKISNGKLAKFYLTHPLRLIKGMQYTAGKSFITSTSLGMYSREYSEKPITHFDRFVLWSSFRESKLPKKLLFIFTVFLAVFLVSLFYYLRGDKSTKNKMIVLWMVMFIGAIQFPMPFVGNGRADTAKQLYLFNFVFDMLIVISVSWILFKIADIIKDRIRR